MNLPANLEAIAPQACAALSAELHERGAHGECNQVRDYRFQILCDPDDGSVFLRIVALMTDGTLAYVDSVEPQELLMQTVPCEVSGRVH